MLRAFFMRRAQDGQAKKPFFQKRKKGFFAQDKQRKKEGRISFTLPNNKIIEKNRRLFKREYKNSRFDVKNGTQKENFFCFCCGAAEIFPFSEKNMRYASFWAYRIRRNIFQTKAVCPKSHGIAYKIP